MNQDKLKKNLPSIDSLFTTEKDRVNDSLEKIHDIYLSMIDDFPDHPFKVIENDELYEMSNSIKEKGVLVPTIIREKKDGRYEMISGHRRKKASELAGFKTIPCIIRNMSDDEATIVMVDSNMQREEILPSERAYAYKMKLDALNHQGRTSDQVGPKYRSNTLLSNEVGDSESQIKRYIRLTYLIPELLDKIDQKVIAFNPAVELSYLKDEEQYQVLDFIDYNEVTPSHAQAIQLKKLSQQGNLDVDVIDEILSQEKPNQIPKIKFDEGRIRSVLPKEIDNSKIEDYVVKAIEYYSKYLRQREINREER